MSFTTLLRRDLALMFRQGGSLGAALSFMLAFVVMIPLALGPDQATLGRLAPGLIWLALLLAVLAGNMSENRIAGPLLWLTLGCALASGAMARPPAARTTGPPEPPVATPQRHLGTAGALA